MAARIGKSAINWTKLAERVPEQQKNIYQAFKAKSDGYLRRVLALPENPPAIDWALYKKKVPIPGLVDEFQKQYSALKIPYPPDTIAPQIDAQEKEVKAAIDEHKKESEQRIQNFQKELAHLNSLIPYTEMTMEDFKDAHPDIALDTFKNPTFWPHDPEGIKEDEEYLAEKEKNKHH